jgi:hypothetical protein
MVPKAGLEPAWLAPPPPQDGVSTNFTTSALFILCFQAQLHLKQALTELLVKMIHLQNSLPGPLPQVMQEYHQLSH